MRRALSRTVGMLLLILFGLSLLSTIAWRMPRELSPPEPSVLAVHEARLVRVGDYLKLELVVTDYSREPAGISLVLVKTLGGHLLVAYGDGGLIDGLRNETDSLAEEAGVQGPGMVQAPKITVEPGSTVKISEYHGIPYATLPDRVLLVVVYTVGGERRRLTLVAPVTFTPERGGPAPPPPPPWEGGQSITLLVNVTRVSGPVTGTGVIAVPVPRSLAPELFENRSLLDTLVVSWGDRYLNYTYAAMNSTVLLLVEFPPSYFVGNRSAVLRVDATGRQSPYHRGEGSLDLPGLLSGVQSYTFSADNNRIESVAAYTDHITATARNVQRTRTLRGWVSGAPSLPGIVIRHVNHRLQANGNLQFYVYLVLANGDWYRVRIAGCLPRASEVEIDKEQGPTWVKVAEFDYNSAYGTCQVDDKLILVGTPQATTGLPVQYSWTGLPAPIVKIRIEPINGWESTADLYVYPAVPSPGGSGGQYTLVPFQPSYLNVTVERAT